MVGVGLLRLCSVVCLGVSCQCIVMAVYETCLQSCNMEGVGDGGKKAGRWMNSPAGKSARRTKR